jgi:hypothetical protein
MNFIQIILSIVVVFVCALIAYLYIVPWIVDWFVGIFCHRSSNDTSPINHVTFDLLSQIYPKDSKFVPQVHHPYDSKIPKEMLASYDELLLNATTTK